MWGIFSISTGAATSFHVALISRFFLGLSEAAYYPGVLFILSRWYKRDELGLRMVYLVCGASASKVIGPLTASAILGTMDGKLGYAAWRWLFFIEGSFTCGLTALAFYMIPDYPSTPASWLTTDEQMVAQKRMIEDVYGVKNDSLNSARRSGLAEVLADWTVWWLAIAAISLKIMMSYENFFPTLAATLGYSPTISLFLCAPPWVVGVTTSFFIVRHSDRTTERFWHIICPILIGIIGFTIATLTMNTAVRYSSLFFMAQSSVSYTIALAWVSNSIPNSSSKRAVALAFVNAFSGLGDIGGSYLWVASWGPSYSKSYRICIFAAVISAGMVWVYRIYLIRLNRRAEIEERALGLPAGFRYIA
ncbi:hypothetical protein SCLCIDRAFT_1225201 [Scleroderma citrinum Foug A]|uniref:Major facilitator superfamily (MFS) profile domain-containing protein n=1 Tax=Scleroderma citrinum Foug A TaxID=1036808 RepID=A0A0C3D2P6_9AGAM|nr:hypothetical protein SCLCIDRAFT_1225201 [Scleroderma citrinum Foug A]